MRGILLAAGMSLVTFAYPASAQEYPTREVKLVCGFVAGSGADIIHRFIAKQLQAISGRTFIVENRPGAAGNIASTYVSKSKPDGYTVYPVGGSALASSVHLYKQLAFNPVNDFEPVGTVLKQGWLLVVDAKSPFRTLQELTAHLKQKKDKASYSTATTNGAVMGELYKTHAGLETVQVN
jgi:tripartite-type tricarboxylate transporter receptor subunit TctC